MRSLAMALLAAVAACSTQPRWFTNCAPDCAGGFPSPPDGGWTAGTCTTQTPGQECFDAGATCSTTTDPCQPVLICSDTDPHKAASCQGKYP
jgi:hypothetical protein